MNRRTMKKIIGLCCATFLLSGCHIYKSYDRPESIDATGIYRDPVAANDTLAANDTTNMGNLSWKEIFRDPKLQMLIEEGLANNVDMQAAILRVKEAKALLTSARLSYLPSLALAPQGSLTSVDKSTPVKNYTLPASASWEVDLFGKLLNAHRGQKASYLQSKAYQQAVRSQLIGGIANAYYSLLMLDRQVSVTEQNVALMKETVRTMEAMKEAGMTTEAAVAQSKGAYHQTEASLADLGNIENITDFRIISRIIYECNSGRTTLDIPSHALVPSLKIRAGGRVGTLGENQELFMIRIFVQPCRGRQKCLPVFSAVCEKLFRPRSKLCESLVFSRHLCPPVL